MNAIRVSRFGERARTLALVAVVMGTMLVPAGWSGASIPPPEDPMQPKVAITAPQDRYVFKPNEKPIVRGTAYAPRGLLAVKLEYWLGHRRVHEELADCPSCKGGTEATWTSTLERLDPGYYLVRAYTYDVTGKRSEAADRGFLTGLERVPVPVVTPSPLPSGTPVPIPEIGSPDPRQLLPAATHPTIVEGTAKPGTNVKLFEQRIGHVATVGTESDGTWAAVLELPTGRYTMRARAVAGRGISGLSRAVTFTVDAQRPIVKLITEDDTTFLPTEPVVIEGTVFDDRRFAAVKLEYWLLDRLVLNEWAKCVVCKEQEIVWQHRPNLPYPGYYFVKVKAFDRAGNESWFQTLTFVSTA